MMNIKFQEKIDWEFYHFKYYMIRDAYHIHMDSLEFRELKKTCHGTCFFYQL